jgi:hypothetical protein
MGILTKALIIADGAIACVVNDRANRLKLQVRTQRRLGVVSGFEVGRVASVGFLRGVGGNAGEAGGGGLPPDGTRCQRTFDRALVHRTQAQSVSCTRSGALESDVCLYHCPH